MDHLSTYVLLLSLLLPLLLLFFKYKSSKTAILNLPPGPWQLPVIGSLHHLAGGLPHRVMRDLSHRYGPLMLLKLGELPTVVVSSPDAAKEIMKTHDTVFATRPVSPTVKILSNGGIDIIFSPYGDHWRQLRKICVLAMLSTKRVQSFRHIREEEVTRLINSITDSSASSGVVNLTQMVRAYVIDVTVRAVIGDKCKDRDVFLRELAKAVTMAAGFNLVDLWPSSWFVQMVSSAGRKAEKCCETLYGIVDGIIKEHEERKLAGQDGEKEEDLLDVLLRIQMEGGGGSTFPLTLDTVKAVIFVS